MDMEIISWLREVAQAEHNAIEKACEEALQSGKHGVLIKRTRLGALKYVGVSPGVPYGEIYEYIGEDLKGN